MPSFMWLSFLLNKHYWLFADETVFLSPSYSHYLIELSTSQIPLSVWKKEGRKDVYVRREEGTLPERAGNE